MTLKIKEPWLTMIFEGKKVWEIRWQKLLKKRWLHLSQVGRPGWILGEVKLVGCAQIDKKVLAANFDKHRIPNCLTKVKYAKIFAWEFKDARMYDVPFKYSSKRGAQTLERTSMKRRS